MAGFLARSPLDGYLPDKRAIFFSRFVSGIQVAGV